MHAWGSCGGAEAAGRREADDAGQGQVLESTTYDLGHGHFFGLIGDAFETLWQGDNRVIRVMGASPKDPKAVVEVVIDEAPMRAALIDYSERVLALSIVISLITAALVYFSLQWLMIRPMRRLTQAMVAFRDDPEDLSATIQPSRRSDEIGVAERSWSRCRRACAPRSGRRLACSPGGAVSRSITICATSSRRRPWSPTG
jgi:hypothetical protein